jgi:FdhD protein
MGRGTCPQANLTLIGRARGKRFIALSGESRIVFDADAGQVGEEDPKHARKGGRKEAEEV